MAHDDTVTQYILKLVTKKLDIQINVVHDKNTLGIFEIKKKKESILICV